MRDLGTAIAPDRKARFQDLAGTRWNTIASTTTTAFGTTLTDVTGLSFALTSGTYIYLLGFSATFSGGGQGAFQVNYSGTTSASRVAYYSGQNAASESNPAGVLNTTYNLAWDTGASTEVSGYLVATSSGTLKLQLRMLAQTGTAERTGNWSILKIA